MPVETRDPQAGTLIGPGLEEARRTRPAAVWQWPDTIAIDPGSADPLGDDQAERHSGWGALGECGAPEGGKHREPSNTARDDSPSAWFVVAVALCCAAAFIGSLLAKHMAWPLG